MFESAFVNDVIDLILDGLAALFAWAPLWFPPVLIFGFWKLWVTYIRAETISKIEWVMLEIILPEEISKSPLAMELVLNSFQQSQGEATWLEKFWKGGIRPWFSLEVVSLGGDVHFFMRIPKGGRRVLESQIYAQYPDVEIREAPDYSAIEYNEATMSMWGAEFVLTEPDPYPIKTYVDYGLDRDPKEELKIDPMTPMLEWLGSLSPREQAWIQILIRAHKKEYRKPFSEFLYNPQIFGEKGLFGSKGIIRGRFDKWKDDVKNEIEKIVSDRKIQSDDGEEGGKSVKLTRMEEEVITALERSITKPAFDVGIRGIYLADQESFAPANIGGLIGSWRSYNTNHLNGFKPTKTPGYDFPWQDPRGRREARNKRRLFDAYRRRSYFFAPHERKPFVLNVEELATIYHFPGKVAATPTFKRLESRKAEPPTRLPI